MADKQSAENPAKPSEDPPYDPTLDLASPQFDPLKALYAPPELIHHLKSTRVYDNVEKFVSEQKRTAELKATGADPAKTAPTASAQASTSKQALQQEAAPVFQRKFKPDQLMLPGTGPKARHQRNLLTRIAEEKFLGPLEALLRYIKTEQQVRVHVRNATSMNAQLTGIIESFDKHWNLAMRDVHEVSRRKKPHRCDAADYGTKTESTDLECSRRLRQLGLRLPPITVKSVNRKYVECSRHLAKVMVRGEQVAVICAVSVETKEDTVGAKNVGGGPDTGARKPKVRPH